MSVLNMLLEITAYSAVIYLGIKLFGLLFKGRLSARLRYALWFLLVARLLLPVTLVSPVHLIAAPQPAQPAVTERNPTAPAGPGSFAAYEEPGASGETLPAGEGNAAGAPAGASAMSASTPVPAPLRIDWPAALLATWLAGAACMLACYSALSLRMRRRIRRECRAAPEALNALLDDTARGMGLRGWPELLLARAGGSPCLTASPRPKFLLPDAVASAFDSRQLSFAIGHELAHYRRKDHLASLLMNLLRCVYWFNPVVWLAARDMRADMEAACDGDFVRLLGDDEKKRYAQTLLALFRCGGGRELSLGMAAGAKKAAERRIRAVFSARESGRGTRCAAAGLALLLLFACFTTACRPTPTKAAVAGKDGAKLEELIQSTQEPRDPAQTAVPSAYTDTFKGADASVTIDIDANVIAPDGALPVIEVRPRAFTMERIREMVNVLLKGEKAYEPAAMTKTDVQEEIVKLRKIVADDAALLKYYDGSREEADLAKAEYRKQIAAYEAMLPSAPETAARKETDWAFHPEPYYADPAETGSYPSSQANQRFIATGMLGDYRTFIQAFNLATDEYESHLFGFTLGKDLWDNGYLPKWRYADDKPGRMTREEAIALAADALGKMGIGDMKLVWCKAEQSPKTLDRDLSLRGALGLASSYAPGAAEPSDGEACSYYMSFVSTYEGVPVLETGQNIDRDQFGHVYSYERLNIRVRDGLISNFDWHDPLESVRVENANVATLPLEEAVEAFKRQMQLAYTLDHLTEYSAQYNGFPQGRDSVQSGTVTITNIQLGLMRVRIKDKPNAYRLVPAWMFSGKERFAVKGADAPVESMRSRDGLYAYAVINALDGSIIDPANGY